MTPGSPPVRSWLRARLVPAICTALVVTAAPAMPSAHAAHVVAEGGEPAAGGRVDAADSGTSRLVRYRGPIEHIFFHPLMPAPRYTLYRGTQRQGFNEWMVTVKEFRRMLPQLYANDWVLVDINSLVKRKRTSNGTVLKQAPLLLPPGKKPLVISIDDLNYPQYMIDNRLNSRLVLDERGEVAAERVTADGTSVVSRRTEVVPILDRFVAQHPDFSIDGAGFAGILGYRTSGDGSHAAREQARAAPVVQRLRQTGWSFASHSYGHPNMAKVSMGYLQRDTDNWETYVEPLLGGNVPVYVFPFGSPVQPGTAKFRYLRRAGFRIFCPIGGVARLVVGPSYAIQDRVHVDGLSLLTQQGMLRRFFDAASVVDRIRPPL